MYLSLISFPDLYSTGLTEELGVRRPLTFITHLHSFTQTPEHGQRWLYLKVIEWLDRLTLDQKTQLRVHPATSQVSCSFSLESFLGGRNLHSQFYIFTEFAHTAGLVPLPHTRVCDVEPYSRARIPGCRYGHTVCQYRGRSENTHTHTWSQDHMIHIHGHVIHIHGHMIHTHGHTIHTHGRLYMYGGRNDEDGSFSNVDCYDVGK